MTGPAADTLHERDVRHLLAQMGLHRSAHTESRDDQCNQAHECKESRRAIESAGDLWIRFRVVGDAGAASEYVFQLASHRLKILIGRKLQEYAFSDAAAGNHNVGARQTFASEQHPWPERKTGRHAIRFFRNARHDSKLPGADFDRIANL